MKRLLLRGYGEIPIKINPIGEQDAKRQYCSTWVDLALICTPLYNETLRGCFTVGGKKKYQKIDDNGELVIEWKKEKSIKDVVVENICYD